MIPRGPCGMALLLALGSCVVPGVAQSPPDPVAQTKAPPPSLVQPALLDTSPFALSVPPMQGALVKGIVPSGTISLTLDGQPVPIAPDGRFLLAFDRDAPPRAELVAQLASGGQLAQTLSVTPRAWRIERVNVPMRPPGTNEAFLARRAPELEQINAARAVRSESTGWRQRFIWPAKGRISGVFGSQRIYQGEPGAYHSGVDVAGGAGAPVVAPADGVVILAAVQPFTLEGHLLMLDHGMGLNSAFLHLSRIDVQLGQVVKQGQLVGAIGATGRATGPHLHWGMKWNSVRIDPQMLPGAMPQ